MRINTKLNSDTYKIMWFDSELDLNEKDFKVHLFNIQDLAYAVDEGYNTELEQSMIKEGLKFPLIAIENNKLNWEEATLGLKDAVNYQPYAYYLIVYGNQRLKILEYNKILYNIPVLIAESHDEAITVHNFLKNQV